MNLLSTVRNSLLYYRRTNAAILAGTMLTAMIITGSILIGDSAKKTLHHMATARLGRTELMLFSRDRFVDSRTAVFIDDMMQRKASAGLMLNGTAFAAGNSANQANKVQISGFDSNFSFIAQGEDLSLSEGQAAINQKLASYLSLEIGDSISVRIEKPGILPRDAPLSSRAESPHVRALFTIKSILPDYSIGRFSPSANQIPPFNIFINAAELQRKTGLLNKANIILTENNTGSPVWPHDADLVLKKRCTPADLGITVRSARSGEVIQIESDRVFLDPVFERLLQSDTAGALTYMVNSIAKGHDRAFRSTPYSFVTAVSPTADRTLGPVPETMQDNQIIINSWLAEQLEAVKGDTIKLTYYVLKNNGGLIEKVREMEVFSIIEMDAAQRERQLAPQFPGLSDVETCDSWDIGIPMDEALLKDEANEDYWTDYRDTPKAFITLAAGRDMWSSRFGALTSIRLPGAEYDVESASQLITSRIAPNELGYFFESARERAISSAETSMDLGQLFGSMSFFLILAAITLTVLLFSFGVDQRSKEIGTLLAVGFTPKRLRLMFLLESGILSAVGSAAGAVMGIHYTRLLLWGLREQWSGAVANSAIEFYAAPASPFIGAVIGFVITMIVIAFALRSKLRKQIHQLQSATYSRDTGKGRLRKCVTKLPAAAACAAAIAAFSLVLFGIVTENRSVNIFYTAGGLLLIAGLGFTWLLLTTSKSPDATLSRKNLGWKNAARRPGRSLAVTSILACGVFMVFSIFAMKQDMTKHADKRASGTGGFALFAETSLPVLANLGDISGQSEYRLDKEPLMNDIITASIKVRSGDDASCFNLNRSLSPTVLGIDPLLMTQLKAFIPDDGSANPWDLLKQEYTDNSIPIIAGDANTAMWGLEMKVGDTLSLRSENGATVLLRLAGTLPLKLSVFQGAVLMSQENFTRLFPSTSGYNMLLIDCPPDKTQETEALFKSRLGRLGINIAPATERLNAFYSVEAAYLSMFLSLGGLGLLLGTAGLGIVIGRNTMERRSELALMRCIGFSLSQVKRSVITEHLLLIAAGMATGTFASLIAIWPNLMAPGVDVPINTLLYLAAGILASAAAFTVGAVHLAVRTPILQSLRTE